MVYDRRTHIFLLLLTSFATLSVVACSDDSDSPSVTIDQATAVDKDEGRETPPDMIAMGGAKSVTTFFVTSVGLGNGGNLDGLDGADAHCQALATAEYAGDHTWRAYLSTNATPTEPAVHARDRIGTGPWYNAEGLLIAADVNALHADDNQINKERATTERLGTVNGVGDDPNQHDILTGSQPSGTAFSDTEGKTCGNWTSSSSEGSAQVGHHDRIGRGDLVNSWNSEHASRGCSQENLVSTGGAGLFYCFAID